VPERTPALFTLIYVGGFGFVILLLLLGLIRSRRQVGPPVPADLPKEVRKRLGSTSTNRGLRALRWLFVLLAFGMFGFHIYWAHYAAEENEKFQDLSYKDLRARRLSESTLRGWVFDRSGRVDQPLAYYKRDTSGNIRRWPTSSDRIAAIRDSNVRCSEFRAALCLKHSRSSKARTSSSKAIRTCASRSIVRCNRPRWTS
jgi:hypothetical protein